MGAISFQEMKTRGANISEVELALQAIKENQQNNRQQHRKLS
jgi:hypothetical protein